MMQTRFLPKEPATDYDRSALQKVIRPAFLLRGVVSETIIAFATLGKGLLQQKGRHVILVGPAISTVS